MRKKPGAREPAAANARRERPVTSGGRHSAMLPALAVFVFAQRYIVAGAAGAVKG